MNILARGLSSVLYYPPFKVNYCDDDDVDLEDTEQQLVFPPTTILKVTKKRCALQALSIKQQLPLHQKKKEHFVFPDNELISFTKLTSSLQDTLWSNMNVFTRTFYAREEFVLQPIAFAGRPWNHYFGQTEPTKKTQILQLLEAVLYLHEHNVTHNDISCRNVLIDLDGCVKLIDWEFAVYHFDEDSKKESLLNNLGPFSLWRLAEVLDRYKENFNGQVKGDWFRVWQIIESFEGEVWDDIKNRNDFDDYIKQKLLVLRKAEEQLKQVRNAKGKQAMEPW